MMNKAARFATSANEDDIRNVQNSAIPIKTEKATQWAVKTWQVWAERDTEEDTREKCMILSDNIQFMNKESLSFWVPRFILEVRKKNGDSYPPKLPLPDGLWPSKNGTEG